MGHTRGTAHYLSTVATLVVLLVVTWLSTPGSAAAANDTIAAVGVSAYFPGPADLGSRADVRLTLKRGATVTVTVRRTDGTLLRRLVTDRALAAGDHGWSWDGRNANGKLVRDGKYRIKVKAVNGLGKAVARRDFRKGLPKIYPVRPGAITIALDAGHGGVYPGAVYQGYLEKDFNLDIARRLRALLEGAGVSVVMTRTGDTIVNTALEDVNGDGTVDRTDDLAARVDVANLARADLYISIHNNAAGCECYRGTEVFTSKQRSWTPEGLSLATVLQARHIAELEQFRDSSYYPIDRGVKGGTYYAMHVYDPLLRPRPSLSPTLLTESLFVNNDIELALLRRAETRQSIAMAFYRGIARYLKTRDYGIRYGLRNGPTNVVTKGAVVPYELRVTNRGNRTSAGWTLELRAVPRVPRYDGSETLGDLLGSVPIPDGLAPGGSVNLALNIAAPATSGDWWVKADVRLPTTDRRYLSQRGVISLQLPLTTE